MKTVILHLSLGILIWFLAFGTLLGCILGFLPTELIEFLTATPFVIILMLFSYFGPHIGVYLMSKGIHIIRFGPPKSHLKLA